MLIDGKKIAQEIYANVTERVAQLTFVPIFCDVLVGNDPASRQYVNMKAKLAERVGMKFLHAEFPADIAESELIEKIKNINFTPNLCGLIVQLPLPAGFNTHKVLDAISPDVDVDYLNSQNLELLFSGQGKLLPPTPAAVLAALDSVLKDYKGKKFVVIGKGDLVGKPVTYLLQARGVQVSVIDRSVKNPEEVARGADVIITATGKPGLVRGSWVKMGAIVIDAGTADSSGGIVGDVNLEEVGNIAGFVSPVPGGVGPITVAKLLENVVIVAERKDDR